MPGLAVSVAFTITRILLSYPVLFGPRLALLRR